MALHDKYVAATTNRNRKNKSGLKPESQIKLENDFADKLDDLFDIAHADALTLTQLPEDREFLRKQREKGRQGSMLGVDGILAAREKRQAKRLEQEQLRKQKSDIEMAHRSGKYQSNVH